MIHKLFYISLKYKRKSIHKISHAYISYLKVDLTIIFSYSFVFDIKLKTS